MPLATIHKMGGGDVYHIHFLQPTDPGFGGGAGGGTDPDYGQGRPRPDRPDQGLPGSGAHPGNRPPGSGGGGIPDNELPEQTPPQLAPGWTFVLIRHDRGKWQYAAIAPGSPPPRPLPPGEIEHPGNRPPGSGMPDRPSQGLPGQPPPPQVGGGPAPQPPQYPTGQPVPPMPTPTQR